MNRRSILVLPPAALVLLFFVLFSVNVRMAAAQAEQELGLRLVGTAVADEKDKSFAIVEVPATGGQRAFHEGDRWGDLLIKKIEPGYVVIATGRGEMTLSMGPAKSPRTVQSPGQGVYLDRKEVDSTLPDYTELMQQIRVRPRFEGGEPAGFVIYRIEPGSIFARMGLKDGDVITAVNGKAIATTQQTREFYDALKEGGTVALDIRRRENRMELHFEIH